MDDKRDELSGSEIREMMRLANTLAGFSRSIILDRGGTNLDITFKSPLGDPVTNLDCLIEKQWKKNIRSQYPEHSILGEETGFDFKNSVFTWVLDPVDGTDDLIRESPLFGSIISVLYRGEPVVALIDHPKLNMCVQTMYNAPVLLNGVEFEPAEPRDWQTNEVVVLPAYDDLGTLENCERLIVRLGEEFPNQRIYRNAYGHTMVALGRFSACLEADVSLWDLAATKLLIEQSKGKFVIFRDSAGACTERRFGAIFGRTEVVDRLKTCLDNAKTNRA